jgi:hypothetical protein
VLLEWTDSIDGAPASPQAMEDALLRLEKDETVPLAPLADLATRLAARRPSEALFPLVDRFLSAEDPGVVVKGINLAASLGSKRFLPALCTKLDSLDRDISGAAKQAIDAILSIEKMREEVRQRLGQKDAGK